MPATSSPSPLRICGRSWQGDVLTGFRLPPATPGNDLAPKWVAAIIARGQRHLVGESQEFGHLPYAFDTVGEFAARVYRAALTVKSGRICSMAISRASSTNHRRQAERSARPSAPILGRC